MKVIACGQDRTREWGEALAGEAVRIADHALAPQPFTRGQSALFLRTAEDEGAYLRILLSLLIIRCGASVEMFDMPRKTGPIGCIGGYIRKGLWKLLRYQHERIVFQQNSAQAHLTTAMVMVHEELSAELAACRKRIDELEAGCRPVSKGRPAAAGGDAHAC